VNRAEAWSALRRDPRCDLLVVGGGIAGAGVALEAVRTGARVVLVEARDFASGTSSRSSKLVHGGLRYLAQGQFATTRASVRARDTLLRDAPGLVTPLRFMLPMRRGDRIGRRTLGLALALFDAYAGGRSRAWHGAGDTLARVPGLDATLLEGAWSYADAQTDDARLVLRVLAEARALGAITLNHARVDTLLRRAARVTGVAVTEAESGETLELAGTCVVNATGAEVDCLRAPLGRAPVLRPLRGSHLLLPGWRFPLAQSVAFAHPRDRRPVFATPWQGATVVGTTDVDHERDLADEPAITAQEVDYLLEATHAAFPSLGLGRADVRATWAGVRPVVASGRGLRPSEEAREHLALEEDGLVSITAGKLTTFRDVARQALRLAAPHVPALAAANDRAPLFAPPSAALRARVDRLPERWRARLLARHGPQTPALVDAFGASGDEAVAATEIAWAELRHACTHEAVHHLDDLLLRRTRLGLLLPDAGAVLAPKLEPLVRAALGWNALRWQQEWQRYRALVARCYALPNDAAPATRGARGEPP
jgi:glycerol-3-phosphate dehydrogenase